MKLKALDLYCGAGGAGMGLHLAGFDVTGIDLHFQKNYPFTFIQGNALEADLTGYDLVWASPPCQRHSALKHRTGIDYECFIAATRERLKSSGCSFIIENVAGAPLINPVTLCGSSFGLGVRRHRIFESNRPITGSVCQHHLQPDPIDVTGTGGFQPNPRKLKTGGKSRKPKNLQEARDSMGMQWARRPEISQAIPPAFSEFLGLQIIDMLRS